MQYLPFDYFSSLIEYLYFIFSPEKYFCLVKRRVKIEFKVRNIRVLRDLYYESEQTVKNLQIELANLIPECIGYQQRCQDSEKIIKENIQLIQQLEQKLKSSVTLKGTLTELRQQWLEYHIQRLIKDCYGAGQFYELYEARKQAAVKQFLCQHSSLLTEMEIKSIKQKTEYDEHFEPYTEVDEETGELITLDVLAYKIANGEV